MKAQYYSAKVLENIEIIDGIYKLSIGEKNTVKSGQFYMLKGKNALLGRPISVCNVEKDKVEFLYAVIGKGTKEFKDLKTGDEIKVIGPLGNGFDDKKGYGKVALVGGGIGIAPILELSKNLRLNKENKIIDLYAGFREEPYLINELSDYVNNVNVAVERGNKGSLGYVTDILKTEEYDTVLCCGPEIMMKKVIELCKKSNTEIYVSMEKHMACGVGACLVCTCKTKEGNKRTCKDGPVFNGYEVEL